MRVDCIKPQASYKVNTNITRQNQISYSGVSFKGAGDELEVKTSFVEKIQKLFKKEEKPMTKEREKSLDIDTEVVDIYDEACALKKGGKKMAKETARLLSYGKDTNYRYAKKVSENSPSVTYGKIDPETGFPKNMTVWDKIHPSKPALVYTFNGSYENPFAHYTIEQYEPDFKSKYDLTNNTLIRYTEQETNSDIVKTLFPQSKGFYYIEEKVSKTGEVLGTVSEIYINETDEDFYSETEDGVLKTYIFDDKEDMWKLSE